MTDKIRQIKEAIYPDELTRNEVHQIFLRIPISGEMHWGNNRRTVTEIKQIADCDLESSSSSQEIITAMLEYGDILMYGLKNIPRNYAKAIEYYQMAAAAGCCEAKMTVAIIFHCEILRKYQEDIEIVTEVITPKHLDDPEDQQKHEQMWILLEEAAQTGFVSFFSQTQSFFAPTIFQRPPAMESLRDALLESKTRSERAIALIAPPQYPCSTASCTTFVEDASTLCLCHRCQSVKYCSRQCQSDDWKTHVIHCKELPTGKRRVNLRSIKYREPEADVILSAEYITEEPGKRRFTNYTIGEITMQCSTVLSASRLRNKEKSKRSTQSIMSDIRFRNMPYATFDELFDQAVLHVKSCSYSQAIQCFTYALLKNDMEGEIVLTRRDGRMKLATTIYYKIYAQILREKEQEKHDMCHLRLIREDCAFLLDTGVFDLNELGDCMEQTELRDGLAQSVNLIDKQAKAWRDEYLMTLEGGNEWIPQAMITTSTRRGQQSRKKKFKKKSKPLPPPLQLYSCFQLIEQGEVKNAGGEQDCCPICQTQWNHFIEPCYAVVLPCLHAICCTCLVQFQNGCTQEFDTEVDENVQVSFTCPLCRETLDANLSLDMAKMMVAKKDAIPSYDVFMRTVHFEDFKVADAMIIHLLEQHEFQLSKVGDVLFNMIGLLVNDDIADEVELIPDEKQSIYVTARAPVRVLEGEIKKVQDRYNGHWKASNSEKRNFLHKLKSLKERLGIARENAANDIFERMNASGSMGTLSGKTIMKIDIHGLHVEEAKAQISEYILPVLQVISKVILITGRGRHGESGASILKPAMEAFLSLEEVKFRDVPGNDGAICIVKS